MTRFDCRIDREGEFLRVVYSGTYDMQEAFDSFAIALRVCRYDRTSKVLIDYSKLDGVLAATEKILYALNAKNLYEKHLSVGGQKLKVAFFSKAPHVTTYRPGLQIAEENGLPFDLFTDIEEAYRWLEVIPA